MNNQYTKFKNQARNLLIALCVTISALAVFMSCSDGIASTVLNPDRNLPPITIDPNINNLDANGFTPLIEAVKSGSLDKVKEAITKGANVNLKTTTTALNVAAESGSVDMVKLLMDNGADVNLADDKGNTPAINAAKNDKQFAVLTYLLETGHADLSIINADGINAFFTACSANAVENVKVLLANGQDVNQLNADNLTGLYITITNKLYDTFHYLVDFAGVDLTGMLAYTQTLTNAAPSNTTLAKMETELLAKAPPLTLTATEITATGPRPYYVAFSINTNMPDGYTTKNYFLALKESNLTKPTAAEILAGTHYQRNLSSTPINIFGWGTLSKAVNPTWNPANWGNVSTIFTVSLSPNTEYILWGLPNGGTDSDIIEIKRFTTSALPSTTLPVDKPADNSIFNDPIFTLRAGEGIAFAFVINTTTATSNTFYLGVSGSTKPFTTTFYNSLTYPTYAVFGRGWAVNIGSSFRFIIKGTEYWFKTVLED